MVKFKKIISSAVSKPVVQDLPSTDSDSDGAPVAKQRSALVPAPSAVLDFLDEKFGQTDEGGSKCTWN